MDKPKFNLNDKVILKGVITGVTYRNNRGWLYEIFLGGCTIENMQMGIVPTIHEKDIELIKEK